MTDEELSEEYNCLGAQRKIQEWRNNGDFARMAREVKNEKIYKL